MTIKVALCIYKGPRSLKLQLVRSFPTTMSSPQQDQWVSSLLTTVFPAPPPSRNSEFSSLPPEVVSLPSRTSGSAPYNLWCCPPSGTSGSALSSTTYDAAGGGGGKCGWSTPSYPRCPPSPGTRGQLSLTFVQWVSSLLLTVLSPGSSSRSAPSYTVPKAAHISE
jgi:hypothetical protein